MRTDDDDHRPAHHTGAAPASGQPFAPGPPRPRRALHGTRPRVGVWLFPLVWALFSSFKRRSDIFAYPPTLLPPDPTLDNYTALFDGHPFWQWFLISTLIAFASTTITVVVCSMAGYGFAKYRFRFQNALFNVMFSSLAIPFAVIVVPLFVFLARTGTADPWFALVVPWVAPAFGIFMMRQFVEQSVPDEILDAGRIDGVGEAGLFWRLVMPLLRPAIAALAVWSFLNSYNNFLWPLIVIGDPDSYTLPLGLQAIFGAEGRQYDIVLAGSMLAAIPSILVFVALRKQLIDGLSAGALKG
ncbi:carbohydrate ABC transporter permease [Streptomyces hainanensis]|uniref:Carbohydrate ABC transporter permease n=1 Tax=Streptomyces hainanensis TaxID=402648 RepID=A0A4R4SY85_9ACTN|nr:carbohydrate ABC transporter permease [Streptomyces hainanensis]TDC68246.1 carbohydrate ABC transporter permease [Streptomyces hainanensis]